MVTVIDAENLLLGRLASTVAKRALAGEEFAIVNAEKAIVSGARAHVLHDFREKRERGSREGGPFYPRRPDHIVKRTIRGMLPYKRQRGVAAYKGIKTYVGVPHEFADAERESLPEAHIDRLNNPRYVTIGSIATFLGAKY